MSAIERSEDREHWFHGLIDRREAEARLVAAAVDGAFLVRESRSRPSAHRWFVLSFRSRASGINHFRVQHFCGHFYIGSKAFPTLESLVRFYRFSDLLRGERLIHSIAPQEPPAEQRARRLVAVLPYTKMADSDELTFQKSDTFVVHNDLQNGWLWCTNDRNLESGLVFGELLEPLDDAIDQNDAYEWFHQNISKEEAVDRLARAGVGAFLVRPSDNSRGNYSLFFHTGHAVQRFRIERTRDGRFAMGGRVFVTLADVVSRYQQEQIVEGFRLERPVTRTTSGRRNDDAVYQTLRESRELQQKARSTRTQGFLLRKSQKRNKWKSQFAVVSNDANDASLFFYDSERRMRPKAIVDLNYSCVYSCHDSLFDRQHVFQVVERALPCLATAHFLAAPDSDTTRQWVRSVGSLCRQQSSSESSSESRFVRSVCLSLIEGRNLPLRMAPNPLIEIQFNRSVRIGRTSVKCPPDPIWEEDFNLEDIPNDIQSIAFVLLNKGKRKDSEIAETVIDLQKLRNNEEFEQLFQLSGLCPPVRDAWGQVLARIRFSVETVLSLEDYNPLKDLILSEDLETIGIVEQFCRHRDRQQLSTAVLRIAKFERKTEQIIRSLIEREVRLEDDTSTLFRANSLTSSLIETHSRSLSKDFIRESLQSVVRKVFDSKTSCELNPSRLADPSEAVQNAEHLLDLLDAFVDHIFAHSHSCPPQLRFICGCLQRAVIRKWPNDMLLRSRVVSSFIFLRLICPSILNPKTFQLINDLPSETASRTLILVAKSVQNLSNLNEFGSKSIFLSNDRFEGPPPPSAKREPWMEVVNPFILKNKSKMIRYLDDLSNADSSLPLTPVWSPKHRNPTPEPPTRELAFIHSICEQNMTEIRALSERNGNLRKLSVVIEMLYKRKEKLEKPEKP
ncbi:ras GTPase-activating protein 1-like [Oppia nitens]|uniref:ras GTPase-activating protein 1-like n=1 Tax=Oppia nitens TaxID=1686743 RepID=UPI0023DC504F|nr:ras GTPase-activating protein 1-like [Oppia nitens]